MTKTTSEDEMGVKDSGYVNIVRKSVETQTHWPSRTSKDVDGGWAWVVCAVSFVLNLLFNGQIASSAIYFVAFHQAFHQSRSATSWIFGVQSAAVCIAGPLVGVLLQRWGPRIVVIIGSLLMGLSMAACCFFATSIVYLMVFYGICGIGGSFIFTSAIGAPALFFKTRLFVATGISIAGAGLGIIVTGPILEWAIDEYGWRGGVLIHGGISLQGVICGALIFALKPVKISDKLLLNGQNNNIPANEPASTPIRILLKDLRTWLIIICMFQHFLTFTSFILLLKDFVIHERALNVSFSVVAIVVGLTNTIARVTAGFFARLMSPAVLFAIASFSCGAALATLTFGFNDWTILTCVGVINFGFGQQAVLMNLMSASIFGGKDMATVFSFGLFASIGGIIAAPSIIGRMKDVSGSYNTPLLCLVGTMSVAGLSSLATFFVQRWTEKKRAAEKINEILVCCDVVDKI